MAGMASSGMGTKLSPPGNLQLLAQVLAAKGGQGPSGAKKRPAVQRAAPTGGRPSAQFVQRPQMPTIA